MVFCLNLNILFLLQIFLVGNFFYFFLFFEFIVLPLYFLIGFWGTRERKVYAGYLLFLYTLVGSILSLFVLFYIWLLIGSLNFLYIEYIYLDFNIQKILFICLFLGFSVKIPLVPVHM